MDIDQIFNYRIKKALAFHWLNKDECDIIFVAFIVPICYNTNIINRFQYNMDMDVFVREMARTIFHNISYDHRYLISLHVKNARLIMRDSGHMHEY